MASTPLTCFLWNTPADFTNVFFFLCIYFGILLAFNGRLFLIHAFPDLEPSANICSCPDCRFKPLQKVDGMSDSLCGSSQHCNSTPEQSVAAQSQHHQQYIGKNTVATVFPRHLLSYSCATMLSTMLYFYVLCIIKSGWLKKITVKSFVVTTKGYTAYVFLC